MSKERYQNPIVGDVVRLGNYTFNGNSPVDVEVKKIEILAITGETCEGGDMGLSPVLDVDLSSVQHPKQGFYYADIELSKPEFTVGYYIDRWTFSVYPEEPDVVVDNRFRIYREIFYTTPIPIVYDFNFLFQPNKIRKGSKQYIRIEVLPNVPRASDLQKYYENLIITGDLFVSMEMKDCGQCLPQEKDLRTVFEDARVDYREMTNGFFLIDTEDLDVGVYNIWFKILMGENIFLSDKMNFQIFD